MFETSRPQSSKRGRLLFYELLPLSLTLHAIVVGAVAVGAVWQVKFPTDAPRLMMAFQLAEIPPPPPPPPPPPAAKPQQVVKQAVEVPKEIVAPTVIPDQIPIVTNDPPPVVETTEGVEGGVEGGVAGGEIGGVVGGVIGSVITELPPPPPPPPSDGRVHVERDAPLKLGVISQNYPIYPREMALRGVEDQLVIRYVIGTDGKIKEVTVIQAPDRKEFVQPTLRAIRGWRFRPFERDGMKQEVVHELTVNYRLVQPSG